MDGVWSFINTQPVSYTHLTVLADNGNWIQLDKTSDNVENVTNNTFNTTGRIFKLNVSRPDTTGQEACVSI